MKPLGRLPFEWRISLLFGLSVIIALAISIVSIFSLNSVIESKDRITARYTRSVVEAERARWIVEHIFATVRAYLITRNTQQLREVEQARNDFGTLLDHLSSEQQGSEDQALLERLRTAGEYHKRVVERLLRRVHERASNEELRGLLEYAVLPRAEVVNSVLEEFLQRRREALTRAIETSNHAAQQARTLQMIAAAAALGLAALLTVLLRRVLSDRNRFESERAGLLKDLQNAVDARDDFISIAAHELKTPLTSLRLRTEFASLLIKRYDAAGRELPEELTRAIGGTHDQALRLSKLLEEMLDVSRITSRRLPMQPESLDLVALVKEVIARLIPQSDLAGCPIVLNQSGPVTGSWDRLRLEQVISNLLTNAMKYGERKPISVSIRRSGDNAVLTVKDEGIGIAKEDQKKIFDRFERLSNAMNVSGTGLGLYVTRQIVEAHGGSIGVESELGKGTSLIVSLPLNASSEDAPGSKRPAA